MNKFVKLNNIKKSLAAVSAGIFLCSTIISSVSIKVNAETSSSIESNSKSISLEVDASTEVGSRLKTETYNNTIGQPWDRGIADIYKDVLDLKVSRNFFSVQTWYTDQTKSIEDPVNSDPGANVYSAFKLQNDQVASMAESILVSIMTKSVQSDGILFKNGQFDYDEFEKVLKKGLLEMKRNCPKLIYIEAENEPDLDSCHPGADKSSVPLYVLHYERFVKAIEWVNTQLTPEDGEPLKVGGPVLASFSESYITKFVDLAKEKELKIDFIAWHHYNIASLNLIKNNQIIRDILNQRGYNDTAIYLTEYGWKGGSLGTDEDFAPSDAILAKQAAFMTDAALLSVQGGVDIPFNWVSSHSQAMWKNQFLWEPAVGKEVTDNGGFMEFPVINTNNSGRYLRLWTPPYGTLVVKEIEFYDENNEKIQLPATTNGNVLKTTDGDMNTKWITSNQGNTEYDLGEAKTVSKVRIAFSDEIVTYGRPNNASIILNDNNNRFNIKVTNDRINYTDIVGTPRKTPYYHTLYMQSMLGDTLLQSTGASIETRGVRMQATKNSDSKLTMMVWNQQADDSNTDAYNVNLNVKDLPSGFKDKNIGYKAYIVDRTHSNLRFLPASSDQYAGSDALELYKEGVLQGGDLANLSFKLNANAIMFVELTAEVDEKFEVVISDGKNVEVSSGSATKASINDGDIFTSWSAENNAYPQWWKVDLGSKYDLSHADIKWANSEINSYKYKIEVSNDDNLYTTLVDKTGNDKYGDTSDVLSGNWQFVKFTVTSGASTNGNVPAVSVDDFKVYREATGEVAQLSNLEINGQMVMGFNPLNTSYSVVIPSDVEVANIKSTVGSGFTATPANTDLTLSADGSMQRHIIYVSADNGSSSRTYTIDVRRASSNTTVGSIVTSAGKEPVFENGKYSYDVLIPSGIKEITVLSAKAKDTTFGALAEITKQPDLRNGDNTAIITVTAENGTKKETILKFLVAPEPERGKILSQDDFEDGDFSDWTIPTGAASFSIETQGENKVLARGGGSANYILFKGDSFGSDYVVEGRVQPAYTNILPGIVGRVSDDGKNYYYLRFRGDENKLNLEKCVDGSLKPALGSIAVPPQEIGKWYSLKMVFEGSNIKCYLDDELVIEKTDTDIKAGKAGFRLSNGASKVDDFIVSEYSRYLTKINKATFKDNNNTKINELIASSKLNIEEEISNEATVAQNVTVIAALYDSEDKMLLMESTETKTLEAGATAIFNTALDLPEDITGCKVKVFVWDSVSGMKALNKVINFPGYDQGEPEPQPEPEPEEQAVLLSQGKAATAGSFLEDDVTPGTTSEPGKAVDGDVTTKWTQTGTSATRYGASWWKVDLGADYKLTKIDTQWATSGTQRAYLYEIYVSTDDITYTKVVDKLDNRTYVNTSDVLDKVTARYVRVDVAGNHLNNHALTTGIHEIKIYGVNP